MTGVCPTCGVAVVPGYLKCPKCQTMLPRVRTKSAMAGGTSAAREGLSPMLLLIPGGAVLLIRDVTQLSMLERARRDMVANVSHELRTPLASVKLLVETLQSDPPPAIAERMLNQMAQ